MLHMQETKIHTYLVAVCRLVSIMLLILPIMLLSTAQKTTLLCSRLCLEIAIMHA